MAGKVRQRAAAEGSTGGSLITNAKLKQLYATMLRCRLFTERVRRLRKQPPSAALYAASLGQEAIATGCAVDLRPQDTITFSPHNSIAGLVKGVELGNLVAQLYAPPPSSAPSSTQSSILVQPLAAAIDIASANQRNKSSDVVVAFTCQTATALEGWRGMLKAAASRRLPLIFVVENNPWDVPANPETHDQELLSGITNFTVDGNDVVAVYRVACESIARLREGGGPVLVEATTYRAHPLPGLKAWRADRDPLPRMERYLTAKRLFTARWKNQLVHEFSQQLDAAFQAQRR